MFLFLFLCVCILLAVFIVRIQHDKYNWRHKSGRWYIGTRFVFCLFILIFLSIAYHHTKTPNFQIYGLELHPNQEVFFGWNPEIGQVLSHKADEHSILKLKLFSKTPRRVQITELATGFLFKHDDKYLNVIHLRDGDRINIKGKELVFRQKSFLGFNMWVGVEIDQKKNEYERAETNLARVMFSFIFPSYSDRYLALNERGIKAISTSSPLCVFRRSGTSDYLLTGPGLKEITINGNRPIYNLQLPATGRLAWWRWDGRGRRDAILLTKSSKSGGSAVTLSFERRHAVSLEDTKEIKEENERILITNQRFTGTNPQIFLPWLFPSRPFFGYLRLESPKDSKGDFTYNNGSAEYACSYNQQLPSPPLEYKIILALTRSSAGQFLWLFVFLMLIFAFGGWFWWNNEYLRAVARHWLCTPETTPICFGGLFSCGHNFSGFATDKRF